MLYSTILYSCLTKIYYFPLRFTEDRALVLVNNKYYIDVVTPGKGLA